MNNTVCKDNEVPVGKDELARLRQIEAFAKTDPLYTTPTQKWVTRYDIVEGEGRTLFVDNEKRMVLKPNEIIDRLNNPDKY